MNFDLLTPVQISCMTKLTREGTLDMRNRKPRFHKKKSPTGPGNRKVAHKLSLRVSAYDKMEPRDQMGHTRPGSRNPHKQA